MSGPVRSDRPMTLEEYFAFEEASTVRHEYVGGEIYAMSGVSRRHSRISGNVFARLWTEARGGACRVHQSEVRVRIGTIVYYPDVMVACGPEPDDPHVEDAPCLLVEAVSPSTETTDRREKLFVYKGIQSLATYLIVDQDRRHVERWWRDADGGWRRTALAERGEIPLPCPARGSVLTLDEIYEDVTLPSPEEWRRVREAAAAYG
jgi:Uma2 family endonuclease